MVERLMALGAKNRLHLDFPPDDRDAEVERPIALGATRADFGRGGQTWVMLADPEGNEFCVLVRAGPAPDAGLTAREPCRPARRGGATTRLEPTAVAPL
jgi:hypothetical protein